MNPLLTIWKTQPFTIILPHRRNAGNNDALSICLDCIQRNTVNDFNLVMDAAADEPLYPRINRMVKYAQTDCIVYMASDMFLAPRWDVPMLELWNKDTIVTGVVVEPGVIPVYALNLCADFGRKPETFRRAEFEVWTENAPTPDGEGWYCPYMISRAAFLDNGGLYGGAVVDGEGFSSADEEFFTRWKASGGQIVRARSYAYHLQRYSVEAKQREGR